jgi:hypothetical protein
MSNFRLVACLGAFALLCGESPGQTAVVEPAGSTAASTTTTTTKTAVVEVKTLAPDALVMSAGSVLVVRGNQKSRLETELRLTDGSILTPGGTVRRGDGSATALNDGQAISADGKIGAAPAGSLTETTSTGVEVIPVK